jgi:hypothetical protein
MRPRFRLPLLPFFCVGGGVVVGLACVVLMLHMAWAAFIDDRSGPLPAMSTEKAKQRGTLVERLLISGPTHRPCPAVRVFEEAWIEEQAKGALRFPLRPYWRRTGEKVLVIRFVLDDLDNLQNDWLNPHLDGQKMVGGLSDGILSHWCGLPSDWEQRDSWRLEIECEKVGVIRYEPRRLRARVR